MTSICISGGGGGVSAWGDVLFDVHGHGLYVFAFDAILGSVGLGSCSFRCCPSAWERGVFIVCGLVVCFSLDGHLNWSVVFLDVVRGCSISFSR